ncbi:hypothetical protein T440DRAFT_148645 [Plenodomus tracheiphilus IPT5]|uniref:UBA domain-containing protein n=1 Tax=Plenodomus tracheiphilus IPT5 TaxID=1408161 RepID=A0A6A7B352_9PLEO|nr:hypothetical protein T440DRAFT_148645 [Plenodomus tracheiphilus IPT5]
MTVLKNKSSKKSATILHAVPGSPTHDTALHQQSGIDIAQSYQWYVRSNGKSVASPSKQSSSSPVEGLKGGSKYGNATSPKPAKYRSSAEFKKALNTITLRETIGTYRHGKIQWRKSTRSPTASETSTAQPIGKNPRPKIQVVIPGGRDRPLPALPFFDTPNGSPVHSTLPELKESHNYDVSPPSATQKIIRNSIVSPLAQLQSHMHPRHGQRSVNRRGGPGSALHTTRHRKSLSQSSNGSEYSRHSDASSIHSNRSSKTSVEIEDVVTRTKTTKRSASQSLIQSSIVGTIPVLCQSLASSPDAVSNKATPRVPPSSTPPRRYPPHPPIKQDTAFKPTCEVESVHCTAKKIPRKPTIARRSSKRNTTQRSRVLDSTKGVIDKAISRSASREFSSLTPTLSQAVGDLEDTLISFTTEQSAAEQSDQQHTASEYTETANCRQAVTLQTVVESSNSANAHCQVERADYPLTPPPKVPRKSSKRQSAAQSRAFQIAELPDHHIASQMARGRPRMRDNSGLKLAIPEYKRITEDFELTPIELPRPDIKRTITAKGAETVILGILDSLETMDDLFAAARVDWGFYHVFKRHELELIKSTLHKMSPPAWEFREIAFPGHDLLLAEDLEMTRPEEEYTPTTYLQLYKRDKQVISDIKSQILEKCQSFLRPEVTVALVTNDPDECDRVDSALWRIWTFCKIFGSGKGREEDIVAQMDWLKGGDLAHEKSGAGIMTTDYMNGTLISAPECFARGNGNGLTAEQLFDMMELWNCLGVLLQGFAGKTPEARQAGVFEPTHVRGGDIDREWAMLDEWCNYLLTFGLSTVLDLSVLCQDQVNSAFTLAAQKGLVNWKPPVFGRSRRKFLSEATSRIYEDKIAHTYAKLSTREVQRQQSKLRIQRHISELRYRKNTGERGPMISMDEERPMSEWDTVISNLTRLPPTQSAANNIVTYIPSLRSANASKLSIPLAELATSRTPSPIPRLTAQPLLPSPPPSTVPSINNRYSIATSMPPIDEHPAHRRHNTVPTMPALTQHPFYRSRAPADIQIQPHPHHQSHHRQNSADSLYSHTSSKSNSSSSPHSAAFAQHPQQLHIYGSGSHENTADKAIYRIVEMGFTAEEAKEALRLTDAGDGLRVDGAVELLLRRQR